MENLSRQLLKIVAYDQSMWCSKTKPCRSIFCPVKSVMLVSPERANSRKHLVDLFDYFIRRLNWLITYGLTKRQTASAAVESPFWPSLLPERVRLKWRIQWGCSRWSLNNEGYVLGVRWKLKPHAAEAVCLSLARDMQG